MTVSAASKYS